MTRMEHAIKKAVGEFGMLKYFPSDAASKAGVMELLERMVRTPEELAWLVRTMVDRVGEWRGPKELRGVFCTRFAPADGVDVDCLETPGFTPEALEGRSAYEHEEHKFLGAGASVALLPAMEAKWEALPPENPPEPPPVPGERRAARPLKQITEHSEAEINQRLRDIGAA
jgi:hypothetical protein